MALDDLGGPAAHKLEELSRRARRELAMIDHPAMAWMPAATDAALDVLIVGAGQSGLVTSFQLNRERVTNHLVIDRAPARAEGPWRTYARMPTLRSPKEYTGPDLGVPCLTYQSWHETVYGAEHWRALHLIAREDWAAYLDWLRATLNLPVENDTELLRIDGRLDGRLDCRIRGRSGERTVVARKVVLATGQDGCGEWWMPDFVAALPNRFRAHTCEMIDFAALAGKRVAVLGAGASAMDNAATALEAGAARVDLFCRRAEIQRVQPYRWLTFAGFLRHLSELDDAWRWRFMSHILGLREGFPPDTYARCMAHAHFHLHTSAPWSGARVMDGSVEITTGIGPFEADYLICGTGIRCDFAKRPELAHVADAIATWGDRYSPPTEEANERLAGYPYLSPTQTLMERTLGAAPFLRHIHVFNIGATMSFGPSGSSINAMNIAVPKLVAGVTRGLFEDDLAGHWASLQRYDVKMFELIDRT
jgi:cation diffusion facilitator CzcD-associated flavoprotein CzcO